jgi:hypothetical protein
LAVENKAVSAKTRIIFGGLGWPGKVDQFSVVITFSGYFHRNRQKFLNRRKYFWPIFGSFFLDAENNTDLLSVVFSSHQKLICTRGSTYPHFNFTIILN